MILRDIEGRGGGGDGGNRRADPDEIVDLVNFIAWHDPSDFRANVYPAEALRVAAKLLGIPEDRLFAMARQGESWEAWAKD